MLDASLIPLFAAFLIFAASMFSLRFGISVVILEIIFGILIGNYLGFVEQPWMTYLASFGGVLLTFLAGAEVDLKTVQGHLKESLIVGFASFIFPFIVVLVFCSSFLGWTWGASLIAALALSTTSIVVIYSVLLESGQVHSRLGKMLLASTFVAGLCTTAALNLLFTHMDLKSLVFWVASALIILLTVALSGPLFNHPAIRNKVIRPEIKYVFLVLFALMALASWGGGHAILPAYVLGVLLSSHFIEGSPTQIVRDHLRTVAYAVITPFFFILAGLKVSLPLVAASFGLFITLFLLKQAAKFVGLYFVVKKYFPGSFAFVTLLLSTGLTLGVISSMYGFQAGLIDQTQFSVLMAIVILSAVIPVIIAQKWFQPSTYS